MDTCEYKVEIDFKTKGVHIINEYGCNWYDGIGYSPSNEFCGECDKICEKKCTARK